MAQGRSTKFISMIDWIRTSRLSVKCSLSHPAVERIWHIYDGQGQKMVLAFRNRSLSWSLARGGAGSLRRTRSQVHLTERIYRLVLESQLPHKIVNLLFTISDHDARYVFCGGVDFSKRIDEYMNVSDEAREAALYSRRENCVF